MKTIHAFLLLTCGFSHLSLAQQIIKGDILSSIDPLKQPVSRITQPVLNEVAVKPFALSELPDIADTVTLPLNSLAPELEIKALNGTIVYKEVEVEDGWRAIERQWVMLADDDSVNILDRIGADVVASKPYNALGLTLIHFVAPLELDSKSALKPLFPTDIANTLDRNHVFSAQGGSSATAIQSSVTSGFESNSACLDDINIGMVDSNIDLTHQAFQHSSITLENIVSKNVATPVRHGTAVASLLVGKGGQVSTLLPNANLYLASIFHRQSNFAQGATTVNIIAGLNWLVSKQVSVINMSLAGPDNHILALALDKLSERNVIVVAAAGNEGPLSPPLYPAAYENVIAVSAIDHKRQVYRWANRGEHIDFAALGVNVPIAQPGNGFGLESGTSMASPVIAAMIACYASTTQQDINSIKRYLAGKAIDLGESGKDPVFGYGFIAPN